jgi:NAD+ diphosphatase
MNRDNIGFISELAIGAQEINNSLWFVFEGNKLLVKKINDELSVPNFNDIKNIKLKDAGFFGMYDGKDCYFAEFPEAPENEDDDMVFQELRMLGATHQELFFKASRGLHLMRWFNNNKYCGKCGSSMKLKEDEVAVKCPECGFIIYPRISPAIIVAVTKGDQLLLARNARNVQGWFSVIAGFVEPGENLEQCVAREVKEEVGVEIKNIKYFGSQPWPFPDSLMLAFTAEYAGGEIKPDMVEIVEAGWYKVDEIPRIPSGGSVARKLIEWFIDNNK